MRYLNTGLLAVIALLLAYQVYQTRLSVCPPKGELVSIEQLDKGCDIKGRSISLETVQTLQRRAGQ
jgi:hypothetical protein